MASIGSLEVSLAMNASSFNGTVAQVNRNMKAMSSELQALKAKGSDYEKSIGGMSQKQDILTRSFDAAGIKLQEQRRRYDELVASGTATEAQIERQANAVNQAQTQYNRLERELAEVTEQLRIQSSQWTQAGQRMQEVGSKLTAVGNSMKQIGQNMSMYVTAPLAAMGAGIVKIGMDFDSQMSKVSAVSGATGADFDALRGKAQELGASTKFTATQVAEGMEYLALAGYDTNQILSATGGVLNLAAAGAMDLGNASDILTDVMSAFGMKAKESGHAADVFAYAQANANTNVEQMGEAMKYVAPMANQMGWSLEETSAAMMKLADNGLKGSIAGQAFASSLGRLAKPTKQMRKTMDELGLSFFDAEGNMKSLPDIVGHLETNFEGLTMQQKSAAITTLFGAEAYKHWAILLESGSDTLAQYTKELEGSDGTAQRMADTMNDNLAGSVLMLKSALEGLAIQFSDLIKNDLRAFAEWLTKMTGKFAELSDGTKKTILGVGALAAAIGPVLLIGGALISSVGTIVTAFGSLALHLGIAGGATTAFGAALAVVTGPIGLTVAAIGALGVGAVLVGKEMSESSIQVKGFGDKVSESTAKAVEGFLGLSDKATVSLNQLAWSGVEVTGEMATKITEIYKSMGDQVLTEMQTDHAAQLETMTAYFANSSALTEAEELSIIEAMKAKQLEKETAITEGQLRITEIMNAAKEEKRALTEAEQQEINAIHETMKNNAIQYMSESEVEQKVILENLKSEASKITAEQAAEVVKNSVKQKDEVVKEAQDQYSKTVGEITRQRDEMGTISAEQAQKLIDEAKKQRDETVSNAEDMHRKVVSEAQKQAEEHVDKVNWETGEILSKWEAFKSKHSDIFDKVNEAYEKVTNSLKEVTSKAYEFIKKTVEDNLSVVVDFVKEQLDKLKKFWDENGKAITGIVQLYFGQIKANIEAVMSVIKGVFEMVWPVITSVVEIAWNTIKLTVGTALDAVLGVIQTVLKVIQGDWEGAWETIKTTAQNIMDNIKQYFENVNLVEIGENIIQGFIDGFGSMVEGVKTSASFIIDQIKEKFGEKFEELKTSIIDWFTSMPSVIESKLTEWGTAISNWFTSISANTASKLEEWWTAISDWFTSVPPKIAEKLVEWATAIQKWTKEQNEENKRQFGEWWEAISEWFTSIPEKITSKLGDWGKAIKDWFTSIPEEIANKLSDWWDAISDWFSETYENITSKLGDWGKAIGDWFSEMPSNIGDWLSDWWEKISTWFSEIPEKISTKLEEWWKTIKGWFDGVPDKAEIKDMGKKMIDKVAEGNTEKKPELLDKLGKIIVDVALGALAAAGVALIAAGREIISRLIEGVQATSALVTAKFEEIKGLIISKVKEVDLLQIGRDIVQGLINGIGEMFEPIQKKAEELASKLPKWVKDKLGIKSPSRVFMAIGRDTGEGLALGIEEKEKRVEGAMKDISDKLIKLGDQLSKEEQAQLKKSNAEIEKIETKLGEDIAKIKKKAASENRSLTAEENNKMNKLIEEAARKTESVEEKNAKSLTDKMKKANKERYDAIKLYIEDKKSLEQLSVDEEAEIWKKAIEQFAAGTKERVDAQKNYKKAVEESYKAELDSIKSYIDGKKELGELSLTEEAAIWERTTELYGEGTKERIEAQKAYQAAVQAINKEITATNKEYSDQIIKINDDLIKSEEALNKAYEDAVSKRENSLVGFKGLFDEFNIEIDRTGEELMKNLESQVVGFEGWQSQIEMLSTKAIDKGLLAELREMGPNALAEVVALNGMTDTELTKYSELYRKKSNLARTQAEKEMEGMRKDNEKTIKQMQKDAEKELRELHYKWEDAIKKITTSTGTEMSSLEQVGRDAGQGLLKGLTSQQGPLESKAKEIANSIKSTIQSALEIRSPSRVMRGFGVNIGQGLVLGMDDMVDKVSGAAQRLASSVEGGVGFGGATPSSVDKSRTYHGGETHIHVYGEKPSPSEIARRNTQALRQQAMEWGMA
ncbi:phage tail tape measure protein [Lysinibacillus sp. NPDC096418]|uniref:phage tail tape measure protein n=1 Tax=Lysinibacillus sp. NPDC096418 TaxID=3364138 RepID=UPI00380D6219